MPLNSDPELAQLKEALAAEFELEQELGRGGMGVVFRARDIVLDRHVALKVLPPTLGNDSEIRSRFLREARTAGKLSHPHIVTIHRADERGGYAFFAMTLVDGETLGSRLMDRGPLPAKDVIRAMRESAWALAYAHARGVIHRDVKPDNIMVERGSGRILVTDFGIARNENAPGLTMDGHVAGTAHYMSPEQIQGKTVDGRSDIYSLGVVGYYLLSGHLPFDGSTAASVLVAHLTQKLTPLRSIAPHVSAQLAAVIERCLAKNPDDRFVSAEALEEALAATVAEESEKNTSATPTQQILSEDQAAAVWKRAAQLQAEAAAKLEFQTRTDRTALAPHSETGDAIAPTGTYKAKDVEAAAVEAGISQRYVALALSELPSHPSPSELAQGNSLRDQVGRVLIGTVKDSLTVSRIIRSPARDVLRALGRTFQGAPYNLTLREQIGEHPLDGGIIVFNVPDMYYSAVKYPFTWTRYGMYAQEMRVSLRVLEHDRNSCEVSIHLDLRAKKGYKVWGYGIMAGSAVSVTTVVSGLVAMKTLAIGAAVALGPAALVAAAGGTVAVAASKRMYRYEIKKTEKELGDLLLAVETSMRSNSIFESDSQTGLLR